MGQYTASKNELSIIPGRGSATPDPGPGPGKSSLEDLPVSPEEFPASGRQRASRHPRRPPGRRPRVPRSSDRRPRPPSRPSADQRLAGPGGEDAALLWREPGAGDPLHLRRAPRRSSPRSPSTRAGRSCISTRWATRSTSPSGGGGSCSKAAASASPLSPGLPGGHRHDAAPALRGRRTAPISGAIPSSPGRRPPSTMNPPRANAQVPIAERCPRETARASAAGSVGRPCSSASARATGQPQLGAGAEPAVRGDGAVHDERGRRRASRVMRAGTAGRTRRRARRRGPPPDTAARGRDFEQQGGRGDRGAESAEPPTQRAPQVQHPEVEPRRRLDEDASAPRTYSVSKAIASCSRGPAVLSTMTWSLANSSRIWSAGSRWVRVARMVASSTAWRARLKPRNSRRQPRCTTRVSIRERGGVSSIAHDLQLAPGAGRLQHHAAHHRRGEGGELGARTAPPCAKSIDVVGQVDDRRAAGAHVPEGGGLQERLEHERVLAPLHAHGREVDRAVRAGGRHDGLDDHRTRSTGGGADARGALSQGRGSDTRSATGGSSAAPRDAVEEVVEHAVAVLGEHRLRVELHAVHRVPHVLHRHDLAVLRRRGHLELRRAPSRARSPASGSGCEERARQAGEEIAPAGGGCGRSCRASGRPARTISPP